MGRPGTPGPEGGEGGGENSNKATFSATVVLLGIISFILGVIAVAVPYWGQFRTPHSGMYNVGRMLNLFKVCINSMWYWLLLKGVYNCQHI